MDEQLTPFQAFESAIEIAGSKSALARIVGCTPGNISQLVKKGSPLPGRFALAAERGTGVPKELLAPDIYPHDVEASCAPLQAGVVSPGAPIVACDRGALSHREATRG